MRTISNSNWFGSTD